MKKSVAKSTSPALDREILEQMLQGMVEGVIFLDAFYTVRVVNAVAEKLLCISKDTLMNQSMVQVMGNKHPLSQVIKRIHLPQERFIKSKFTLTVHDGTSYILEALIKVIFDGAHGLLGMLILLYDVTQQSVQEQATAHFIASTSHELRTPLAAIKAALNLLHDKTLGPVNDGQMNILSVADRNVNRLTAFVQKFLDMAKFEVSAKHLYKKEQSINKVIEEVVNLFDAESKSRGVPLIMDLIPSIPAIPIDRDHIYQVLCNLVSNALKFTAKGKILISSKLDSKDPRWVVVSVKDSGVGIKNETLKDLFIKDQPLDTYLTEMRVSSGLGLALCKEIISLHGGRIWATSKEREGATFSFSLPSEEIEISNQVVFHASKILVVDDEESLLETLKILLQAHGYDVTCASGGEQALRLIEEEYPDLVLLDLKMPGMDGFQVCTKIREQVQFREIPIVVLTAFDDEAYIQRAFFKGANGYIVKPFESLQIINTIKNFLKERPEALKKAA